MKDWQQRLGRDLGMQIEELTGDTESTQDVSRMESSDVICTTPEKFGAQPMLSISSGLSHLSQLQTLCCTQTTILVLLFVAQGMCILSAGSIAQHTALMMCRFSHKTQHRPGWREVSGRGV